MVLLYFLLGFYFLLSLSLYKVFEKIGFEGWKAVVPGLNFVLWCQAIGRPKWWATLLLVPIVNIFILTGMCVAMVRSFKQYKFRDSVKAALLAPIAFLQIGLDKKLQYDGPSITKERNYLSQLAVARKQGQQQKLKKLQAKNPYYKTPLREWTEAVVFAVFAAAFIRMFTIEAFAIPTSSMEGTLLIGDHIFVSKAHYGIRTPQTIAMLPLLHNRIPFLNKESYLKRPKLEYKRFPALESIDHNDPVVFNLPVGDSIYITPERNWSIYDVRRGIVPPMVKKQIQSGKYQLVTRPVDKGDHYVKHCVGLPGEQLQIIDRQVYINGVAAKNPEHLQYRYLVKHDVPLNESKFSEWGITAEDQDYLNTSGDNYKMLILSNEQRELIQSFSPNIEIIYNEMYWVSLPQGFDNNQLSALGIDNGNVRAGQTSRMLMTLTKVQVEALEALDTAISIEAYEESDRLFPNDPEHFPGWTVDNYGPVNIPKAGTTITLSPENIAMYERAIRVYEGNELKIEGDQIFINGEASNEYTFQYDYYWMMGDNRHNSEDSRSWGFVPETHIVGKPIFIYFATKENSIAKGINWDRMFSSAAR